MKVLLLSALLLTGWFAGCASPEDTGDDERDDGADDGADDGTDDGTDDGIGGDGNAGTYTSYMSGETESLDPAYDYETAGGTVLQQVYETLLFYDGASAEDLVPRLAAEMPDVSADGTVYTLRLRDGVLFHDGNTMTAEDVKFSLDRIVQMNDPDGPAWIYGGLLGAEAYMGSDGAAEDRAAYLAAGGVEVVDERTVRITLTNPDSSFPYRLAFTGSSVVSKAFVCEHAGAAFVDCLPPPGETRDPYMDEHEAGTGPFQLDTWQRGEFIALERFADYWGDKAHLERIIIKKVEDFNTRLLALRSGEATSIYVASDHFADVEDLPGLQIVETPVPNVAFIGFNQKFCRGSEDPEFESCMNTHADALPKGADGAADPDFFGDIHMRMAWTYAFSYDTYYNNVLEKHGVMLNGVIPQGLFGYDASIPRMEQDVEAAKTHLAMSEHPGGFEVTIYYNIGNTLREKTSNLIKQNIEALLEPGRIKVNVQGLDWSTAYLPKQRAGGMAVFYLGWVADYAFPDNFAVTFGHTEKGIYAKRISYDNPELNAVLDDAIVEQDRDELKRLYKDAVEIMNADFAYLWLAQVNSIFVAQGSVEGYVRNPMLIGVQDYQVGEYKTITHV